VVCDYTSHNNTSHNKTLNEGWCATIHHITIHHITIRSMKCCHLSRKIISANLKILCSKMQPLSGNQRPELLTALMNMSRVLCLPRKMHLSNPLQVSHAYHRFWKYYKTLTFCSLLTCACHAKRRFNVQKWRVDVVFCTF
jgi:hypothetical protein